MSIQFPEGGTQSMEGLREASGAICEQVASAILPGPWIDWSIGVGYRQDAGAGSRGQGIPAVRS